jgi:acyl-homoserine-lactone acylase
MNRILIFFLLLSSYGFGQIDPGRIVIARDSFGVPHIFAPTDAEVAYGLAWAHAEDDFETLQLVVLSGKAKLGTALGRKGAEADYVIRSLTDPQNSGPTMEHTQPGFSSSYTGLCAGIECVCKSTPGRSEI